MLLRVALLVTGLSMASAYAQTEASAEPNDQNGEQVYISDDLYAYLHAGPGRNYRILGSVAAGSQVTLLNRSDDGEYIEVIDDKQRTGWVEAESIMQQKSFRVRLPEVQQQLNASREQLDQANSAIDTLQQRIAELESQQSEQGRVFTELKSEHDKAEAALATKDQSERREWMIQGGIIALAGLIMGILVTYLPKKKRNRDTWMN